jgi:hypothetical protein
LREASLSHPLKLSRQVVETVVNGSEVFILVVHLIPICSSPLPHAFLRSFDGYAGPVQPLEPARAYEQEATGAVRCPAVTFVHYGKQAVNRLIRISDRLNRSGTIHEKHAAR